MAKKTTTNQEDESRYQSRESRKETLRAKKQDEQLRGIKIGAIIVGVLLVMVLLFAVISEFIIAPNRSVAEVSGQDITLQEWQDRVVFERAQRIKTLEDQLEMFGGDVGIIQQYSYQTIGELQSPEQLGEAVLDNMLREEIIRQGAEERSLVPSDAEVEEAIAANFNYYDGDSPTPFPPPAETVAPTPSLTPISESGSDGDGISEEPIIEPEDVPTITPFPTATPVSKESFDDEYSEFITGFEDLGANEEVYKQLVGTGLMVEQMMEALAEEQSLSSEDTHASFFVISFSDGETANDALDEIGEGDFLTVWNEIRSQTPDPTTEEPPVANASEILWQTQSGITNRFNADVAAQAVGLEFNNPSDVITVAGLDGSTEYVIIMVSGREVRALSEGELRSRQQQLLLDLIDQEMLENVEKFDIWRQRVPVIPALDPKFLQQPTPVPEGDLSDSIDLGLPESP